MSVYFWSIVISDYVGWHIILARVVNNCITRLVKALSGLAWGQD